MLNLPNFGSKQRNQALIKAKLLQLKLSKYIFARDILAMKKLEIEKTKPTFIISVLKVDIIKVGLVFSISNFFINKIIF